MKLRRILVVASITVVVGISLFQAAPASASTSSDFVSSINSLRSGLGLGTLTVDSRLQGEAQAWAQQMANAGAISHNPALGSTPGSWSVVGENVGVGGDVPSLMAAFIASPHHYENLTNASYNSVGVGVAIGSDGRIYTTHDFAAYPGAANSTTRASTPASSTATAKSTPAKSTASTAVKKTTVTVAKAKVAAKASSPAPTTTTTTVAPPAPVAAPPAPPAPPAPVAPVLPAPSNRIVQGLAEVGSITTQG